MTRMRCRMMPRWRGVVSFSVLTRIHLSAFHAISRRGSRASRSISPLEDGVDSISPLSLLGLQGLDPELAICVGGEIVPGAVYVKRESPGAVGKV